MLERRRRHEPLQHILGYTEFFGMRLDVSPDVLIPRPETEQVVEEALRLLASFDAPKILDVGTGSGCIALAIKHTRPDAKIWACDVSKAALSLASSNAHRHRLTIEFFQDDVFGASIRERVPGGLDLLVSNPPYVAEDEFDSLPVEVREFEPHVALLAPSDPLIFYRRLGELGMGVLRPGRHVVLETAADHGEKAADLLRRLGYVDVVLQRDYAGRFRILRAVRPSTAATA